MIFQPTLVEKILSGEKTETRRPLKQGVPCRYRRGHTYAVQPGRGKRGVARVAVLSAEEQRLCDLSDEEVRAEGFTTRYDFMRTWVELHPIGCWDDTVWVIRFALVAAAP